MKITFEFTFPCSKCQQPFTELDFKKNNYSLILLPNFSFQHLACPSPKTKPNYPDPCGFEKPLDITCP